MLLHQRFTLVKLYYFDCISYFVIMTFDNHVFIAQKKTRQLNDEPTITFGKIKMNFYQNYIIIITYDI